MQEFMYRNFKMLLNAETNEEVDAFIIEHNAHAKLVQLVMQWITYSYPCLPFDEHAKDVRKNAWQTCLDYAKMHNLELPNQPQCLNDETIKFFNKICG